MVKTRIILFAFAMAAALSLAAAGQEVTAREAARGNNIAAPRKPHLPHACTLSKAHPCVYYGGDIDLHDPNENGLSNENTAFIPQSYTYTEIKSPGVRINASFSNNLASFGVLDPQTATWQYRSGVSEGNGGTLIGSGDTPAQITDTHRNAFRFEEFEVLTTTPLQLPKSLVWFSVTPDCTNPGNDDCTTGRYFGSDTDGLNAINRQYSVTAKEGTFSGPVWDSEVFFVLTFADWCNDFEVACGDTMSYGFVK